MTPAPDDTPAKLNLGNISTSWREVHDPLRFVMTYGPAVRRYLLAILRDEHEVDEAVQDLFVQVVERGFTGADPARGRFRDYLRAVVRNAARKRLRRTALPRALDADPDLLPEPTDDTAWLGEWRTCVLDQAWRALDRHQRAAGPGNLHHTVLRLTVDHPDEDSVALAMRAGDGAGRPLTAEAFRKQQSRARRVFAELIAEEVRQTLDHAADVEVDDELASLGLLAHVRPYLPPPG